jgi:hypothetical protein
MGNETGMEDGQIKVLLQFERKKWDSTVLIEASETDKNEQEKRNGEVPPR